MVKLSLRKYAALLGVSHTAVVKAISTGYIVEGWDANEKKIIVELADKEWGNNIKAIQGKANSSLNQAGFSRVETFLTEEDKKPISEKISLSEAKRRKEICNAEIARLAALKEQGLFVEKAKVDKELFAFGKQLRINLRAIPDQYIDNLMVAKTRVEAHAILLNAINGCLETMTEGTKG